MASQVSKLNYVDAKLGAPTSGQQTTRYIYDSVLPGAGGTNVTFFQNEHEIVTSDQSNNS